MAEPFKLEVRGNTISHSVYPVPLFSFPSPPVYVKNRTCPELYVLDGEIKVFPETGFDLERNELRISHTPYDSCVDDREILRIVGSELYRRMDGKIVWRGTEPDKHKPCPVSPSEFVILFLEEIVKQERAKIISARRLSSVAESIASSGFPC